MHLNWANTKKLNLAGSGNQVMKDRSSPTAARWNARRTETSYHCYVSVNRIRCSYVRKVLIESNQTTKSEDEGDIEVPSSTNFSLKFWYEVMT
jgi:hypothetical protein